MMSQVLKVGDLVKIAVVPCAGLTGRIAEVLMHPSYMVKSDVSDSLLGPYWPAEIDLVDAGNLESLRAEVAALRSLLEEFQGEVKYLGEQVAALKQVSESEKQ